MYEYICIYVRTHTHTHIHTHVAAVFSLDISVADTRFFLPCRSGGAFGYFTSYSISTERSLGSA